MCYVLVIYMTNPRKLSTCLFFLPVIRFAQNCDCVQISAKGNAWNLISKLKYQNAFDTLFFFFFYCCNPSLITLQYFIRTVQSPICIIHKFILLPNIKCNLKFTSFEKKKGFIFCMMQIFYILLWTLKINTLYRLYIFWFQIQPVT